MNNESDELSESERHAFAQLSREKMPPRFLEEQVVASLRAANLIRPPRFVWFGDYRKLAAALAIAVILFAGGAFLGSRFLPKRTEGDVALARVPDFMLIVRANSPTTAATSEAEHLQRVSEYTAWARDLETRGLLLSGEELSPDAVRLASQNTGNAVSQESVKIREGEVDGYFLLSVANQDQAIAIARTCPHLKHGGAVELRAILHH